MDNINIQKLQKQYIEKLCKLLLQHSGMTLYTRILSVTLISELSF